MTIPAQTGVPVQLVKMIKRNATVHQDLTEIIVRMASIVIVPSAWDFGNDNTKYFRNSISFHIIIIFQFITELVCNPPCMNEGKCAEDHNGNRVCFCKPGYSGIQCEHSKSCIHLSSQRKKIIYILGIISFFISKIFVLDICSPNPCYNGGTCSIKHGKVECNCPDGYSGPHCESSKIQFFET